MSSRGRAETLVRGPSRGGARKGRYVTGSPPLRGARAAAAARDLLLTGSPPSRRGSGAKP